MAHAAPPVPLPPRDLSSPAPPPIDTPRTKYAWVYVAVAILVAASVSVALYSVYSSRTVPAKVVLQVGGTRFGMSPAGHAYFGPVNLSGHSWWTVSGAFEVANGVANFGFLTTAQFVAWEGAGFPTSTLSSGSYGGGPIGIQEVVAGSVYYVAWVDLSSTGSQTITITSAMVATAWS